MRKYALLLALAICPAFIHAQDATPAPTPDPATYVPEIARVEAARGNAAFSKGDYKAARAAYERVLDLAPNNLVALVNLGLVEFRAGESEQAEKYLRRAIQQRLETGPAWLTLGVMEFEQGRTEEAFAALSQAVLYDPGNARAHNYLGAVLGRKGWLDGAEAELRRTVEIDPNSRDAHHNLAVIYLQRKPPAIELARRHYFRAIELGGKPDPDIEKTFAAASSSPTATPTP
jgi:tetratricopeptide (TPR) repeat protein